MTAAVIPDSAESGAVDDLFAERERIATELGRLALVDRPVREAQAAVAAIDRAIDALDAEERQRSQEWAASGVGELPEPKTAERRSLVQRRAELESDVAAAHNRAAAVAPRRTELNGEIRRIEHLIFAAKLRVALEEARRLDAEAHELALMMREPISKVVALKMTLVGEAMSAAQNRGDEAAARLVGEAIETLNGLAMPEVGGDSASLPRFMSKWGEALQ